jgi:formylglycine-generating enzyme required for sulfatase activity/uncharacterized ferredoxin-like protein
MNACHCPSKETLEAYVSGRLDDGAHRSIDHHLDACPGCQQALETLDDLAQTRVSFLQPGVPQEAAADDPALRRLVADVKALVSPGAPASDSAATTCTAAELLERLAQSEVLAGAEIDAITRSLPDTGMMDGTTLSRDLAARGLLTDYQARELCAGRGDALVLGNYVLREPIGGGGMGRIFKAYHRRMKREVALKILAPELLRSDAARARFQREVEAVARLSSPHIVAAYDAGEDRGRDYLVMEYVAGRDLADLVKQQGPLPVAQALQCILQAARGLERAHAAGIVHRDVKPANLFMADCGSRISDSKGAVAACQSAIRNPQSAMVKVLDLGLARLQPAPTAAANGDLTSSHVVVGTAAFMAPEQASNTHQVGFQADVYSLGCTLHYLLTGRPPYEGQTVMEVLFAHREVPIPSLCQARPDCPRALDELFRRMMAKRAADRCPDMRTVIGSLERLLTQQPNRAPRPFRARRRLLRVGVTLAASLLVGAVSLFALHGGFSSPARQQTSPVEPSSASRSPAVELVQVPAGEFQMGSPGSDADASPDELPRHRVKITQAFLIGKHKITQAQYQEVMGANPSAFRPGGRFRKRLGKADTRDHPVESVSWLDAVEFCNRLSKRHGLQPYYQINGGQVSLRGGSGFRLPTEAEWEFACRAGSDTCWHFGNRAADLDAYAWHAGNSGDITHPVGQKKPNPLGLHDMHGNVPEWCWDHYDPDYYKDSRSSDPPGSSKGTTRVHRGGAWNSPAHRTRSAARDTLGQTYGGSGTLTPVGLRVVRTAEP